ncbi:MAG: hypothetical protein ACLRQF_09140 [Thomasclavelia ramosa]
MFDDRAVLANRSSGGRSFVDDIYNRKWTIHLLKKCLVHLNYGLNNGEKRMKKAKMILSFLSFISSYKDDK